MPRLTREARRLERSHTESTPFFRKLETPETDGLLYFYAYMPGENLSPYQALINRAFLKAGLVL